MSLLNTRGLLGPGLGKRSTARRAAAVSLLSPPGSPYWWWDAADLSTMYTTEAKTTNVSADEDNCMVWTSKGSDTIDLTTESTTAAEFVGAWSNSSAVTFDLTALGLGAEAGGTTMTTGWTIASIWSTTNGGSSNYFFRAANPNVDICANNAFSDAALTHDGTTSRHTDDEFSSGDVIAHIGYHGDEGTGAWWSRASTSATILTGTDALSAGVELGDNIGICNHSAIAATAIVGDIIVYNGTLADNSITDEDLITYFNEKYGISFAAAS